MIFFVNFCSTGLLLASPMVHMTLTQLLYFKR